MSGWLAGCASNGEATTPTTEPSETATSVDTNEAPPSAPTVKSSAPPPSSGTGGDDAREITATECQLLAQKYGDVTRADQTAKLSPKLTDAQRSSANKTIDDAANTLAGRWAETCTRDLVGKVASESALKCAMSSKSVAAFDTCINGPPSAPP